MPHPDAPPTLTFFIPGILGKKGRGAAPAIKGRPRFASIGGFTRTYTPAKTRKWEKVVSDNATAAMNQHGIPIIEGAVHVDLRFTLPVKTKKKIGTAHFSRPDLDNLIKAVLDGLDGIVFIDDGQICSLTATKHYVGRDGGGVEVRVTGL